MAKSKLYESYHNKYIEPAYLSLSLKEEVYKSIISEIWFRIEKKQVERIMMEKKLQEKKEVEKKLQEKKEVEKNNNFY